MSIIEKAIAKLIENAEHGTRQPSNSIKGDNGSKNTNQTGKNTPDPSVHLSTSFDIEKISTSNIVGPGLDAPFLANEFRHIKRPLLANAFGKQSGIVDDGNIIMVTSSLPGEGKSFIAANLAISMAMERDFTVLLVDADVAMSKITQMFNLQHSAGLTDLVTNNKIEISEVVVTTNFPCLSVIPAGHKNIHAAELFGSASMERIVRELASQYKNRIILFDTPPLLATAESAILSEKVGQIVFVVEANRTPQSAVLEAVNMLNKDKPIGMVLNKSHKSQNHGQYYGYYAYGEESTT